MQTKKKLIYSIQSGLLLAVAFPPFPLFITAFVGFIPLFFILKNSYDGEQNKTKHFGNSKYIYLTFLIYHTISNWWISTLQENSDKYLFFAGVALDILHPLFFLFPFALLYFTKKIIGFDKAIWLFPFIWTIFEYLHSIGDLGYPWLSLAYTQFNNLLWFQILDIQSIYGATLLICFVNVLLYKLTIQIKNKISIILSAKQKMKKYSAINLAISQTLNVKTNKIYFGIVWAIIVIPMVYGWFRINDYDYNKNMIDNENDNFMNIALIQPNINPWDKWKNTSFEQINTLKYLTDSLLTNDFPIHLVIFPETAIPSMDFVINRDLHLPFFDNILKINNTALLTGIPRIYIYEKNETPSITSQKIGNKIMAHYNSSILYQPDFHTQIYDKMKLTPVAERFPFIDYLPFMKDVLTWGVGISSWEIGKKLEPMILKLDNDSIKIGTIICIESIYPNHIRKLVNKGANILVVITNDSWYDGSYGPYQHNIMSIARAIENRRYLARCANSGISCFISPTGKIISQAPQYKKMGISASVPLIDTDELTIYTKVGNILPLLSFVILIIAIIVIRICNKNK
jgi:apolipoprotein N-acyltransferase